MNEITKTNRARRTGEDISVLLEEFDRTKPEVNEFCNRHNISRATFYKWQSRYKRKHQKPSGKAGFARLQVSSAHVNASASLFADVNGIKIYQRVDAAYLKGLL